MDRVRKTFFNPLATTKDQIRGILGELPVGSAHPFSPEKILLCKTENGVEEIDISSFPEDYFFNAVDLGEMGEILLRRMAVYKRYLGVFDDFQIQQAPAATFRVPVVSDQITILAVSELTPTYYDFCFADKEGNACCWLAETTFPGITHSGDLVEGRNLLDYVKINKERLTEKEICVFISGYQVTEITRFLGTSPALMVANHVDKILYIIPVPLDKATIGNATILCPLVIKRDGDSLLCSILPKATTDTGFMCCSNTIKKTCFVEAIERADFEIAAPTAAVSQETFASNASLQSDLAPRSEHLEKILAKENALIIPSGWDAPPGFDNDANQIIEFGKGLRFRDAQSSRGAASDVVLPCLFGAQLTGPVLLATGTVPVDVPFLDDVALRDYYSDLKNVVIFVGDGMTDNARNLATSHRINALFCVYLKEPAKPQSADDVLEIMNSVNINAVTALAGPQSLVVVTMGSKTYFYRGIANRDILNTSSLAFGAEISSVITQYGMDGIIDPRAKRMINLDEENTIILPTTGQLIKPSDLQKLFEDVPVDQIQSLEEDMSAAIPQLQVLLNQKNLKALSHSLVTTLQAKVNKVTGPLKEEYINFIKQDYKMEDPESVKIKIKMLGELRNKTKHIQTALESAISNLANMISTQNTSKRTHDLKRLVRQAAIQSNVEATKSMTFDTLAGYLETHAEEMGVMFLNIETTLYRQLLGKLKTGTIDASVCCALDDRVLHLDGLTAGAIMEQSQSSHNGPLRAQSVTQPILAMPYLTHGHGTGSALAWVCWDEFVNLESPFTVRWMEKCNEAHIAALRIVMRSTLSQAVMSREFNIQPGSSETGHLMSALLMSAMVKLAAMRTTAPVVSAKADDTVTKLMRGLFGNLLTIAGSGTRPLSFIWQLFGLNPQLDVPTTNMDWVWYETVVALYPYTGWPRKQFYENIGKLLDKVVVRVITQNENMEVVKVNRAAEMVKYCKLRNIQLQHSRTIITIFMRMLTGNKEMAPIATRLWKQLPKLDYQSEGYTRMVRYLEHLSVGGLRSASEDLIVASVYTKRSAAFAEVKSEVAKACLEKDWKTAKEHCKEMLEQHARIADFWKIGKGSLKVQNMRAYEDLLLANLDIETASKDSKVRPILDDAERHRVPWQVGKKGQYGNDIEPLDEAFVQEILTGKAGLRPKPTSADSGIEVENAVVKKVEYDFTPFASSLNATFVGTMQTKLLAEQVCEILKVPVSAMRVFMKALGSTVAWEDLGESFKGVVMGLLKDRKERLESRPSKKLFGLEVREKKVLAIGGEDGTVQVVAGEKKLVKEMLVGGGELSFRVLMRG